MPVIIPYRGTLCAVAWLTVAEAYPCMELFWLWYRNRPFLHKHKITGKDSVTLLGKFLEKNGKETSLYSII